VTSPQTCHEASGGNIVDQIARYRQLAGHDVTARAIATLKARGAFKPDEHVNDEKFPPLTLAGYLEMLALGERIARYYRHPSQVHHAVLAGATWEQIAAAAGGNPDQARQAYREWAEGQHRVRRDFPGSTIGLSDEEHEAAVKAAGAGDDDVRCSACGELIGMFTGRQGWQHYRGNGTVDNPVEIYDAGHEATIAGGAR
jgi:hypothetical protein